MSELEEVREALNEIATVRTAKKFAAPLSERVVLLHCTSNYPTAWQDVNLRAMQHLLRILIVV